MAFNVFSAIKKVLDGIKITSNKLLIQNYTNKTFLVTHRKRNNKNAN